MMRSMYSGVAGLKTHQTKIDVVGNNIANVNTTAYKSQSISFSDLMYQTTQHASASSATTGGVNARQIGLGSQSSAISTAIETQGATETTNNPFDLMITGNSFFIVNNGTGNVYTRDGSFYVDGSGNLAMQSNGYYVQGWTAQTDDKTGETSVNKNGGIGKLQVMNSSNSTYPPEGTKEACFKGNIDANDENITSSSGKVVTLEFYDNLGYMYTGKFNIKSTANDHEYTLELGDIVDSDGNVVDQTTNPTVLGEHHAVISGYSISDYSSADSKITISNGTYTAKDLATAGNTANFKTNANALKAYGLDAASIDATAYDKYSISENGDLTFYSSTDNKSMTLKYDATSGDLTSPTGKITLNFLNDVSTGKSGFTDVNIDLSSTTNVNSNGSCTISASKGDSQSLNTGRKMGTMTGVTVSKDGSINASYSNGQTKLLGQIAVAEFANASGLEKEGENLYSSTLNSGDPTFMDVTDDSGAISTGVLEMSNVDLSTEFTNMITAQRGFQANSRIITVSDTLLEELTNLKR